MKKIDVIVIGAGAAGLMAAGQAAMRGASVLLLEKMEKPARKLRITGKGRCNITNTKSWEEFEKHVFPVARYFKPAFMNFSNSSLIDFLENIGLPTVIEHGDRVFPVSQRAQDVAEVLVNWVKKQGVEIFCNTEVLRFYEENKKIKFVEVLQNGKQQQFEAQTFIITTGGLSYPLTGSTGDGFRFAQEMGHEIISLRPSLVALNIENPFSELNELNLRNVLLRLWIDGNVADEEFGEMVFSETGLEGAIVLRLSRKAVEALSQEKKVFLELNCKPALTEQQVRTRLQRELTEFGNQPVIDLLRKWLPKPLALVFIEKLNLTGKKNTSQLTAHDVKQISEMLQSWKMKVIGYGGYERAVITSGGISMKDIDFKTMRSRKINNLFFAGEVLNLDADTGGYNLQIAFSTGFLAGKSAVAE